MILDIQNISRKKNIIDPDFSLRLKEFISDRLKLSQAAFADKIGLSKGYLSQILSGKSGPSAELIIGIYLNYGDYLGWLLTGKEGKFTNSEEANQYLHMAYRKGWEL